MYIVENMRLINDKIRNFLKLKKFEFFTWSFNLIWPGSLKD